MPALSIHGAALLAMAEGKPEEAAYWLHYDGLPSGRWPRGRYTAEDWWTRFERYRAELTALVRS